MLWPCRVVFASLVLGSVSSFTLVSTASAQRLSAQFAETAAPSLLDHARAYRGCTLLPAEFCDESISGFDPQPDPSPAPAGHFGIQHAVSRYLRDQRSIYFAPLERANVKWDVAFILGTTALVATDRHTIGIVSHDDLHVSRNISNVGMYGTAAAAGAIFTTGLLTDNAHARETGWLTAEALANAYPVYVGMQLIAGRERPDQGAGHGRFFQNHATSTSFPSGHSMFTWTMAAVVAHEYPRTWVKVLAYTAAAAVSVTRYTGREHFVGDVALGGFIGYFIGRHIFNEHCSPNNDNNCHN